MDSEKCKVFLSVIETKTLSKTAELLGYTVSGVSRSLTALEEECGVKLLFRDRTGVKLTSEGEELLPVFREYEKASGLLTEAVAAVKGLQTGNVTVGVVYVNHFRAVAKAIYEFNEEYPGVNISIVQGMSTELVEALEDHRVDLVIGSKREGNFRYTHIQQAQMCACVPVTHPCVSENIYPIKRFEEDLLIAPYSDSETDYALALKEHGVVPNIAHVTKDVYCAYSMVEAGLGVSFLNGLEPECWSGEVVLLPTDPLIHVDIGMMYLDGGLGPSASKLKDKLYECLMTP